ncbi:glycosyltransferase family 4 protein [uncultured Marixanthomonas sp.]|uniref:glycosyltransferase family 4 protein n=1 Tax=uncultured Marixanthomonas sp. TaxID=757245 RepID=UPI0030D9E8BE|tara:strand:+ start:10378 stop:11529 length:1152 start_codon:yes stop_codon:yes gene_type:complete
MPKKTKLVVLYQVIMHYRLPFYEKIAEDDLFDFDLFYGAGIPNTKLKNTSFSHTNIKSKKFFTIRLPFKTNNSKGAMPFYPFLFFRLIIANPKVIFSEGSSSLINASIAFLYAKLFGKKFIWWSLGKLKNRQFKGIRRQVKKWEIFIERRSDAIFTYSTQGENYFISNGIPKEKIFIGVNVLDTNKKLKEIKEYQNNTVNYSFQNYFNICFIGSITKSKNLDVLINVLSQFNKKYNNIGRLHVIGDGEYLEEIKNKTTKIGVAKQVVFHGRINKGASSILQYCDIMVLPGLGGLAICEAMLNKLPVITGIADGTEHDLIDDTNGFILENLNEEILLEKVSYLYTNEKIRKEMGRQSFEKITGIYHFDNYYQHFCNAVQYSLKN